MTERVRIDVTDISHLLAQVVPSPSEGDALSHGFDEFFASRFYPSPAPRFGRFTAEAHPSAFDVYVTTGEGQRFSDPAAKLLHYEDGNAYVLVQTLEEIDALARGGGIEFAARKTGKLDATVPSSVWVQPGMIENQSNLGDEQPDGAGFVVVCEFSYPSSEPCDRERFERFLADVVEYSDAARLVPAHGAVGDGAPGSEPR